MKSSTDKFVFITLPRMGTKHVQDQLVRALGVTDVVEGNEVFRYREREFKFSLGEYFSNYGFADVARPNCYCENGERKLDDERKYVGGLPQGCFAHQINFDNGWKLVKSQFMTYYPIVDTDFRSQSDMLSRHGKSYVVKILYDQHSVDQLRAILKLTTNVVGYFRQNLIDWVCSYTSVMKYWHTDPDQIECLTVDTSIVKRQLNWLHAMIKFFQAEGIPLIVNDGRKMTIFGQTIDNFVTREYSRFDYKATITNYPEVVSLVNSVRDIFSDYTPFLDVPSVAWY